MARKKAVTAPEPEVKKGELVPANAPGPSLTDPEASPAVSSIESFRPLSIEALRAALAPVVREHGVKFVHVGGSMPPLFPQSVAEKASRLVKFVGAEHIDAERGGGSEFDVLVFDVINERTLTIMTRAQMVLGTGLESYFGKDGKGRDPEKTPLLVISYWGQLQGKKQGFSGLKLWRVEEARGLKLAT